MASTVVSVSIFRSFLLVTRKLLGKMSFNQEKGEAEGNKLHMMLQKEAVAKIYGWNLLPALESCTMGVDQNSKVHLPFVLV